MAYSESDRVKKREYYLKNREEKLAKAAKHRAANRERHRLAAKKYYEANKSKHRACVERWFAKHPEKKREYRLRHRHGMTVQQWDAILTAQNRRCPICEQPLNFSIKQGVHLDHNHETGQRRGLLCNPCNRGIGYFKEHIERLERAIGYLRHHATNHPDAGTPARTTAEGSSC